MSTDMHSELHAVKRSRKTIELTTLSEHSPSFAVRPPALRLRMHIWFKKQGGR